jgi:hypothetical protein
VALLRLVVFFDSTRWHPRSQIRFPTAHSPRSNSRSPLSPDTLTAATSSLALHFYGSLTRRPDARDHRSAPPVLEASAVLSDLTISLCGFRLRSPPLRSPTISSNPHLGTLVAPSSDLRPRPSLQLCALDPILAVFEHSPRSCRGNRRQPLNLERPLLSLRICTVATSRPTEGPRCRSSALALSTTLLHYAPPPILLFSRGPPLLVPKTRVAPQPAIPHSGSANPHSAAADDCCSPPARGRDRTLTPSQLFSCLIHFAAPSVYCLQNEGASQTPTSGGTKPRITRCAPVAPHRSLPSHHRAASFAEPSRLGRTATRSAVVPLPLHIHKEKNKRTAPTPQLPPARPSPHSP